MLSTTSGMPRRLATFASASMSQMLPAGLPMLSQKMRARVVVDQLVDRVGVHPNSAKRTPMPWLGRRCANSVCVVP